MAKENSILTLRGEGKIEALFKKGGIMNEIAVVVSSCDKYSDVWKAFFTLFFKYWPDCPYPIYLISESIVYPDSRVKMISVKDEDWSTRIITALKSISQPDVIFMVEDYLIDRPVNTKQIELLVDYMHKRKAGYLGFVPNPEPDISCDDNSIVGEVSKGSAYRLSTQAAVWNKDILLRLLRKGESIWDFEINGTNRTNDLNVIFLRLKKDPHNNYPIHYPGYTGVTRGRWSLEAVKLCKKEGIQIDLTVRQKEKRSDRFKHRTINLLFKLMVLSPLKYFRASLRRVKLLRHVMDWLNK